VDNLDTLFYQKSVYFRLQKSEKTYSGTNYLFITTKNRKICKYKNFLFRLTAISSIFITLSCFVK
jgi:hypothetical protein